MLKQCNLKYSCLLNRTLLLYAFLTYAFLFILLFPVQTQLDPLNNHPVCTAINAQHFPEIALVEKNRMVVVWRDARNDNYDIYAQRVDSDGNIDWQVDGISVTSHESSQSSPKIVSDNSGGVFIIWGDSRYGSQDCYVQRIDRNGKRLWKQDGMEVCNEETLQNDFAAVSDGSGGLVVVWEDWRLGNQDIYAQKVSADGIPIWKQNGVPVFAGKGDQYDPVLISDGKGGIIVAWWDFSTPDWNVYAQRIDHIGRQVWDSPIPICVAEGNQGAPILISDKTGGAYCIWSDFRNDPGLFTKSQLFAQHISGDGKPLWQQDGIPICDLSLNQQQANCIKDEEGGFIVVWWDDRDIFADIYAQRVNADGNLLWDPRGVPVCTAGGVQQIPNLVSDGNGGAIVYWLDFRDDFGDTTEDAIYAQRIDANGDILWENNGRLVCNAEKEQITPKAVSLGEGNAIVVWSDARRDDYDIYMQKIPK